MLTIDQIEQLRVLVQDTKHPFAVSGVDHIIKFVQEVGKDFYDTGYADAEANHEDDYQRGYNDGVEEYNWKEREE
jgi:hypothetical protein